MSRAPEPRRVLLQTILYVEVVDANGKRLGRVSDVVAERRGEDLCVTHLVVGARGWIGRFGPSEKNEGRHIPWEQISELGSPIRLHRGRT